MIIIVLFQGFILPKNVNFQDTVSNTKHYLKNIPMYCFYLSTILNHNLLHLFFIICIIHAILFSKAKNIQVVELSGHQNLQIVVNPSFQTVYSAVFQTLDSLQRLG